VNKKFLSGYENKIGGIRGKRGADNSRRSRKLKLSMMIKHTITEKFENLNFYPGEGPGVNISLPSRKLKFSTVKGFAIKLRHWRKTGNVNGKRLWERETGEGFFRETGKWVFSQNWKNLKFFSSYTNLKQPNFVFLIILIICRQSYNAGTGTGAGPGNCCFPDARKSENNKNWEREKKTFSRS
jgi:hypothetical protein